MSTGRPSIHPSILTACAPIWGSEKGNGNNNGNARVKLVPQARPSAVGPQPSFVPSSYLDASLRRDYTADCLSAHRRCMRISVHSIEQSTRMQVLRCPPISHQRAPSRAAAVCHLPGPKVNRYRKEPWTWQSALVTPAKLRRKNGL